VAIYKILRSRYNPFLLIMVENNSLGFLRTCMDKRFVHGFQRTFEDATDLDAGNYWVAANKGGAAARLTPGQKAEFEYTLDNGATQAGWGAHLERCGGLPGVEDASITNRLQRVVIARERHYPEITHIGLLASSKGIEVFTPEEARKALRTTTIFKAGK